MNDQTWHIEDTRVIDLLKSNGFTVEHPQEKPVPGAIRLFTQPVDANKGWGNRYVTSCPIEFNKQYILPDGHVIASSGTALILVS